VLEYKPKSSSKITTPSGWDGVRLPGCLDKTGQFDKT